MKNNLLLKVEDVWVQRPGAEVLRGVNLAVQRGEVHTLLGLNGSGKTSLALTLMGAGGYEPERGRILFDGQDITGLSVTERARLGLTLGWQEPARFEGLVVADYLALGMKEPARERIDDALAAVALSPLAYLGRTVNSALSGGERKGTLAAGLPGPHGQQCPLWRGAQAHRVGGDLCDAAPAGHSRRARFGD
jgi:Fe-S cluster assembly ATP-binding protein